MHVAGHYVAGVNDLSSGRRSEAWRRVIGKVLTLNHIQCVCLCVGNYGMYV